MTNYLLGVLTGIFVGCAGKYFADKYTDKRRSKEKRRAFDSEFESVAERMPELIAEMTTDLGKYPLCREFILMSKSWCYNDDPNKRVLRYYFEDHDGLPEKVAILENLGFVDDITFNEVQRYMISEHFADLLA